jgi:dGTPase
MNWNQLLNAQRQGDQLLAVQDPGRSAFYKDYDRIVFSNAFRRLERKTQVHPFTANDHVHNRLTHSIEVSCIGRSLGTLAGASILDQLPEGVTPVEVGAIVQSAALAHDIGNLPFGHSGEEAVRHWFRDPRNSWALEGMNDLEIKDLQTYEGNAQGFRVLTQLEHSKGRGGMRLTQACLGAYLKYPWGASSAKNGKFSCYQSELHILKASADSLGLKQTGDNKYARHPLVYLVEAADDICYCVIDLEDAVELDLLPFSEVEALFVGFVGDIDDEYLIDGSKSRRLSRLRADIMKKLVHEVSQSFEKYHDDLLAGTLEKGLLEYCSSEARNFVRQAKSLAQEQVFKSQHKAMTEIGAYHTLATLLEAFGAAVQELITKGECDYRNSRLIKLMGHQAPAVNASPYQANMAVMDHISGMTDHYAVTLAQQFGGQHF